ncbi:MAG: hypothetical protein JW793_15040 [Acidobacteria bacterium]|nr:hypothetical protein [Acidobacteriota bacterium]
MGREWGCLAMTKAETGLELGMYTGTYFQGYDRTEKIESVALDRDTCLLGVNVGRDAVCRFSYSTDGASFQPIGREFKAAAGTWIGAKADLFHINPDLAESSGYADFDWFRFGSEN